MIDAELRPRGPYSLRLSTQLVSDACRRVEDGVLTARLPEGLASAWQRPDGAVCIRAESEQAVERMRWCLALDDDHTEFLRRFGTDPLIGEATRRLRGLRPVRVPTVAQALLRALAGQLITAKEARAIEWRIVRAATAETDGLHAPPTGADFARFSPAQLCRYGLGTRRGSALVRLCRSLDLERLKSAPAGGAALRLGRERGLGPWSVGVVSLEGLGRYDKGLARDLGLVKLLSALRGGRWVEAEETDELLEPYGEWAGLASVYMLRGFHRGMVPLAA